ncbi:KilA-N domain-containing protein [Acinetobacter junii]|uniref:KilA-N domain-containing protein n=1 Tax=Acinetobacter junii TaxID=40215 RepID=UPI00244B4D8F|nr:KilA-N domain-containing protein [Acinetobacter junii]MDH1005673.1 KilA-N domain-containing protein [Acinetobacter junii]MDH1005744.1 KilA-N domain-containing protein [Acinetobacter junii]
MTSLSQNFLNPNNKPFVIGDFTIRQDEEGRYCLHDLHKASGALEKHQPAFFMRNKQTKDLIEEIENSANLHSSESERSANLQIAVKVIKGGAGEQGTYVVKELVYAYAMWISPKFHLMVIRAYDSLVMEWVLNGKQTISPEQAGILYNIVHTRANGNKNLIVQMWSRLKNHFKYSASYRELRAVHFEDAKHYLEVMDLNAKNEKHECSDSLAQLDEFIKGLASRYPTLQNPIAHEIAQQISDKMQYQNTNDERLVYYVTVNKGKVIVMPQSVHHTSLNIVKLAEAFEPLLEFMTGHEIRHRANQLRKLTLKSLPM